MAKGIVFGSDSTPVRLLRGKLFTRCEHEWEFYEDTEVEYTGYLERCKHCGEIQQIPQ